ncbi:NAD-dependent epimerase [Salinimicrobium marinum]|uniref:NAD-dependent epimerase n=1 Tax=Salinimicrobium marinum TaxID=680283 RepID=A0A918SHR7_9FLAO|nr:NAD-dependent epimerase/dehydratase family protein [Salinimicrobium marinum]GHA44705.1 NAD-dependent epimerase [Salinimicrobium marinum]
MILVTGGTGLVGSHLLLDLVKSGEKVRAIHRKSSDLQAVKNVFSFEHSKEEAGKFFEEIEWVAADLNDIPALEKAFSGIHRVYHCAAFVTFDPSANQKLRKTNIEGTANIVNFCIKNKIHKLCYVSSIATFDKKPGKTEISETSTWNKEEDHSMYAITKYGAEIEVWRASQEGVPVVIVNPGVIIGPGFWNSGSGELFKKVNSGLKYHFPKVTGFIGVYDVIKGMRQLMESSIVNEEFIMVSENLSFQEVINMTARSLDKPAPTRKLKPWMVFFGWISEKSLSFLGRKRQLTRQSVKSLFEETFYSNEKIKEQLNFRFESIEQVIERTGKIFRKNPA